MQGKHLITILIVLSCFSCYGQTAERMDLGTKKELYPYLGANGLYGYADITGNVAIEPQYERAELFYNGVAIVHKEDGETQLVDTDNRVITIPLKYDQLRLHPFSDYTLLESTYQYTNRWRFWEWKFLPDLSFFGSSARNRLFDTAVQRERSALYWLEGQRELTSKKATRGKTDTYIYLQPVAENTLQVDDGFYRVEDSRIKRIAKGVVAYKWLEEGLYLQKKGSTLRVVDSTGRQVMPHRFRPIMALPVEVEGKPFPLATEFYEPTYHRSGDFYQDDKGNIYAYPDLKKTFPQHIRPYPFGDSISATEILKRAQSFAPIAHSDRFLLALDYGKSVFVLDTAGNWHDPKESIGQITVVSPSGSILWPSYRDVLGNPSVSDGWEVSAIRAYGATQDLFKVSIRNEEQRLEGVWDRKAQHWAVAPQYHQISSVIHRYPFVAFQAEKEGKWGFYDLERKQVHIPPTYDYADGTHWVALYGGKTNNMFYLDIASKKEFRERP